MKQIQLDENVIPDRRLGRHVLHDPRSLNFLVAETDQPVTKFWRRYTPILNQGNLGSCTGNAAVGVLGSGPFWGRLYDKRQAGLVLDEPKAVQLYGAATRLDPWPGQWEPDDTGSSGLAVAKAAQNAGLISSYTHITSLAAAHNAIKTSPFIVGFNWYSGFDNPNSRGMVEIGGSIRGGHEFEIIGYSATYKRWKAVNSWGSGWGDNGYFRFSDATFERLLLENGDGTVFQ